MMPLCVDLSICFIFKNRDIILNAHSTMIKLESTVLMLLSIHRADASSVSCVGDGISSFSPLMPNFEI